MTSTNRFVDYFVVCGIDAEFVPFEIDGEDNNEPNISDNTCEGRLKALKTEPKEALLQILRKPYRAAILDRYPREDYRDSALPPQTPVFVFPTGLTLKLQCPAPSCFSLVFTDEYGIRVYVSVLCIHEVFATRDDNLCIYAPKCLCLISHWPFLTVNGEFLKQLYQVSISSSKIPLERLICNYLHEVPLPPQGRTVVRYTFPSPRESLVFNISRPPINQRPALDVKLEYLFMCLSVENVVQLFEFIILEQKILLLSKNISLLTITAESLLAFLFPFRWEHVYVPVLPLALWEFVNAPTPFFMGSHVDCAKDREIPSDVIRVYLDENRVEISNSITVSQLPERYREKLIYQIKENCKFTPNPKMVSYVDVAFPETKLSQYMNRILFRKEKILYSFLRLLLSIFKRYRDFLGVSKNGEHDDYFGFNVKKFVESSSSNSFTEMLCGTLMFIRFIEARSVPECAHSRYDLVFFDESIDAKVNRSHFTMKKKSTPFLNDNSFGHNSVHEVQLPNPEGLKKDHVWRYSSFPVLDSKLFIAPREVAVLITDEKNQMILKRSPSPPRPSATRTSAPPILSSSVYSSVQSNGPPEPHQHNAIAVAKQMSEMTMRCWIMVYASAAGKEINGKKIPLQPILDIVRRMWDLGLTGDQLSYRCAIEACRRNQALDDMMRLFEEMGTVGLVPDPAIYQIIVDAAAATPMQSPNNPSSSSSHDIPVFREFSFSSPLPPGHPSRCLSCSLDSPRADQSEEFSSAQRDLGNVEVVHTPPCHSNRSRRISCRPASVDTNFGSLSSGLTPNSRSESNVLQPSSVTKNRTPSRKWQVAIKPCTPATTTTPNSSTTFELDHTVDSGLISSSSSDSEVVSYEDSPDITVISQRKLSAFPAPGNNSSNNNTRTPEGFGSEDDFDLPDDQQVEGDIDESSPLVLPPAIESSHHVNSDDAQLKEIVDESKTATTTTTTTVQNHPEDEDEHEDKATPLKTDSLLPRQSPILLQARMANEQNLVALSLERPDSGNVLKKYRPSEDLAHVLDLAVTPFASLALLTPSSPSFANSPSQTPKSTWMRSSLNLVPQEGNGCNGDNDDGDDGEAELVVECKVRDKVQVIDKDDADGGSGNINDDEAVRSSDDNNNDNDREGISDGEHQESHPSAEMNDNNSSNNSSSNNSSSSSGSNDGITVEISESKNNSENEEEDQVETPLTTSIQMCDSMQKDEEDTNQDDNANRVLPKTTEDDAVADDSKDDDSKDDNKDDDSKDDDKNDDNKDDDNKDDDKGRVEGEDKMQKGTFVMTTDCDESNKGMLSGDDDNDAMTTTESKTDAMTSDEKVLSPVSGISTATESQEIPVVSMDELLHTATITEEVDDSHDIANAEVSGDEDSSDESSSNNNNSNNKEDKEDKPVTSTPTLSMSSSSSSLTSDSLQRKSNSSDQQHTATSRALMQQSMRRVRLCISEFCPVCRCSVSESQIKMGWNPDPQDYTTRCPAPSCARRFVARFTVLFEVSGDGGLTWLTAAGGEGRRGSISGQIGTVFCECLSPIVMHKEIAHIMTRSSADESGHRNSLRLRDSHPSIFWNLIWHFLSLHLPIDFMLPDHYVWVDNGSGSTAATSTNAK